MDGVFSSPNSCLLSSLTHANANGDSSCCSRFWLSLETRHSRHLSLANLVTRESCHSPILSVTRQSCHSPLLPLANPATRQSCHSLILSLANPVTRQSCRSNHGDLVTSRGSFHSCILSLARIPSLARILSLESGSDARLRAKE